MKEMEKHMSGILEVYLWLVIGKNIRKNSRNCHIVGIGHYLSIYIIKDNIFLGTILI